MVTIIKHTPGPWNEDHGYITEQATGRPVALICNPAGADRELVAWPKEVRARVPGDYEANHNSRLIAAAPAMLAALEGMLEQEQNMAGECGWCFLSPFGQCERPTCPGVIARAAIAKARGKKEEA